MGGSNKGSLSTTQINGAYKAYCGPMGNVSKQPQYKNIESQAKKMSCKLAMTKVIHPSLLCMKVNSFQDKVAVTEGNDEIPNTTVRHMANPAVKIILMN